MLTLIWCPFHSCVTAMACKRPQSFCQKCRWQVTPKYAYTPDPKKLEWADNATVLAQCGSLSGKELTHNSSGNILPQSSQLTEPLWTEPGRMNGKNVHDLISTKTTTTTTTKTQVWNELSNILPKFLHVRKKPTPRRKERKTRPNKCSREELQTSWAFPHNAQVLDAAHLHPSIGHM